MGVTLINDAIVLTVLLPLFAAILGLVTRRAARLQRVVVCGVLAMCAASAGWLLVQLGDAGEFVSFVGNWPPPFSIVVVFDPLSGVLIAFASFIGICCLVCGMGERGDSFELGWLAPMVGFLIMGVNYAFLTGDLFNLFVAFEIMLMSSYALALRNATPEGIKQANKYGMVNIIASAVFVLAAGMVYGVTGTLNFADLAGYVERVKEVPPAFGAAGAMLVFVFAMKAALFPLWFWLPDTYHTMPATVGGIFAALLSKVGMYAMIRVIPPVFDDVESLPLREILWGMAGLSMVVGGLCALGVPTVRRVMSFVLIAHMGYALFMVSIGTAEAFAAAGFLIAQEMFVIAGLYTVGAACVRHAGTDDLRRIAELHREMPRLSWLAFVLVVAGAGVPPTAAFVAKAWILQEGVGAGAWWLVGLMVVSALLMLIALVRAGAAAFCRLWCATPEMAVARRGSARWATASCAMLVLGVVLTSVFSPVLVGLMNRGGEQIMRSDRDLGSVYTPPAAQEDGKEHAP